MIKSPAVEVGLFWLTVIQTTKKPPIGWLQFQEFCTIIFF